MDTIIKDKPKKVKFGEKDMTKKNEDLNPIEFIEKHYPGTADEFKRIQDEQYLTQEFTTTTLPSDCALSNNSLLNVVVFSNALVLNANIQKMNIKIFFTKSYTTNIKNQ